MANRSTRRPRQTPSAELLGPAPRTSLFPRRAAQLLGVLAVAAALVAWWHTQRPARLAAEAETLLVADPARAAELCEQAVSLRSGDFPDAQILWSRALLRAGRPAEALGCFSLIEDPSTLDPEELVVLGHEAATNAPLLASFALGAVPAESPKRPDALEGLIGLQMRGQNWEAVRALAAELITAAPDRLAGWTAAAQAHERLMDPPAAAQAWQRVLDLESDPERRIPARRRLRSLSIVLGDRDRARTLQQELQQATDLTPADRLEGARLLRLEGAPDEALAAVERILSEQAENLEALELRGLLRLDRRETADAIDDFRRVLQVQPYRKSAHYGLAQALQHENRTEEAARHFAENRRLTELSVRVLKLQSQSFSGDAERSRLRELADAYESLGQLDSAAALRRRAAE